MPYGTLKVDNIIFTNGGVDQTITVSGIVQSISGNITATGTISGNVIRGGTTVSGATVTGAVGQFGNLTAVSGTFTTISGGTQTVTSGVFASGTAANPSISFVGDVDTGIYSSAANEVAISTNGTGRLFIDSSGQLGLGTSSPISLFHINSPTASDAKQTVSVTTATRSAFTSYVNTTVSTVGTENSAGGNLVTGSSGYATILSNNGAYPIQFGTNNTVRATLDSSGRLGLGTSSPGSLLHLAQSAADAVARIDGGSSNTSFIDFRIAGSNRAYVGLGGLTGGSNNDLINYNSSAGNWIAYTNGSERMRLDSSGRLGLATSTPSGQFSVAGAANLEVGFNAGTIASPVRGNLFYTTDGSGWQFRIGKLQSGTYTPQMTFTDVGYVGLGTTSPATSLHVLGGAGATAYATFSGNNGNPDSFIIGQDVSGLTRLFHNGAYPITFWTNATERARIDSSGRLLVGTSSARSNFFNSTLSALFQIEASNSDSTGRLSSITYGNASVAGPIQVFAKHRSTAVGGVTVVASDDQLGTISFQGSDGTEFVAGAEIAAYVDGTPGANDMPGRLVFSTTADGASSPTERIRITSADSTSADGTLLFYVGANGYQATDGRHGLATYKTQNNATANAANSVVKIGQMQTTARSINAAGTVNASGADYAEYMTKAGNFEIAKGDVCGVTADGKLTNVFADAIGFVVKSTNPSYVGGDTWGMEEVVGSRPGEDEPELLAEWEATLEAERQKVDRIAFAGQVPVNVAGATPGQYIVPVASEDGGITGIVKDEAGLTLAEYMRAVGKVIAVEEDGRARIIVKVA